MKNQINQAKKLLESNGYSVLNECDRNHSVNESTDDYYWSGFGYSVYQRDGKYEVVAGEGDVVYTADTTFDAKKWCKEHKTSSKWAADGKWDWTRESKAIHITKPDDLSETHTVELYKSHGSDPERKRFSDYKTAKEFADSQTNDYEEILITIPAAGGPSTVNSWSKSDGWFRDLDEETIHISVPDDLVGHNPKFRVTYSERPGETTTFTLEASSEDAVKAIISGRFKRRGKTPPKFISIEKVEESVNESLPKWQAIEYTKDGPETHVFQTEEEAKEAIKEWKASGSETKGPTPITRQDNSIDEDQDYRDDSDDDQDFVEWDPFDGKKYRVSYLEAYGDNTTVKTNDPKEAIEAWFKYGQDHPTYAFIDAKYKTDAIDLCKAATAELLTDLYSKYKCHYKLDYLISEARKKVEDGQKYFRESGDYGDSVHPFGCG